MNKNSIDENKAIQDGLERFLEEEISGQSTGMLENESMPRSERIFRSDRAVQQPVKKELKTEFATEYTARRTYREPEPANRHIYQDVEFEEDKYKEVRRREDRNRLEREEREKRREHRNEEKKGRGKKQKGRKERNKKRSKLKRVLIFLLILAVAMLTLWYITVSKVYNKMNFEENQALATEPMKEDGVINVLLIGNDSRENGEDGRSDAMILMSISNKTKTIHMTSLLRDMYVDIPGHDGNRLNAAYAYGGPALLCDTIEQNFGIEVNRYILVNFQAFAKLVDAVGGVDMEVTNEEVQWINAYLNEYNLLEGRELTTDYLDTSLSGEIHLNGPQALAYSRNRYIGTDFGRTERQRKVLSAVMKKLPVALATNSDELINELFPNLTTNLSQSEVFGLSLDAGKLLSYEIIQTVIPAEGTYSNASIRGMSVLEVDFEANKAILRKDIYGEE